ncbi:Maleate isomerase [Labrenzia sp. THAF191b]|uniref:maleate cis-trans isomerase family protein n=2 Tax=Hyphomicrobiales TaxID=356 RepID=UPI00126892BD|nr:MULTISPECIES: hypothetical protein [Stappiaceae]MCR9283352.1 hypothetical protein [Paracoccaceae bacterium]MBO9421606.1 arylmalonate decarboxylase [Labrenzia sp. R4_2]QFS97230.1 Maleate isomerase [Labrenzia sp. THAF191b]QFT03545.1 Maleate isomerase [Labrenzia sp. THAF191a]QFT15087.1 Maleate isomerase [Labrenzia sp. THAF187b]
MMSDNRDLVAPPRLNSLACGFRFGGRARFGVILPSGNIVAEGDLAALLPRDITLHVTRLRLTGSSREQLNAMAEDVETAASLVGDVDPAVVGFHCTAVSTLSEQLERDILARACSASGRRVVATSEAIVSALNALTARTLVLITPYVDHIVKSEVAFLNRHGFDVIDAHGLGIDHPRDMAALPPEDWLALTKEHYAQKADAYFVSCTAIRSLEVVSLLEEQLGKPVITSNQVMAWHLLRTAGFNDQPHGFGHLLSHH